MIAPGAYIGNCHQCGQLNCPNCWGQASSTPEARVQCQGCLGFFAESLLYCLLCEDCFGQISRQSSAVGARRLIHPH